jgi:uroporphyrin-III C-methyltransferase/precorrin-2 dehydrogenase/sirohydrochlorin ferrochelatase
MSAYPPSPDGRLSHFPIFVDLTHQPVVLIGDGPAADAKATLLTRAGAVLRRLSGAPAPADLAGARLVIAASDDRPLLEAARAAAVAAGVLFNAVDQSDLCDFQVPSMIERGPITIAIGTGGAAPTLARTLRSRIEAVIPAAYGALASWSKRLRAEVRRRLPLEADRRRFWQQMATGTPAALFLAGDRPAAEQAAERLLAEPTTAEGIVHLVGAGPGDPELLTRRAARLLAQADVIVHDALVPPAILDLARRDADRIDVGKRCGAHSASQSEINQILLQLAKAGRTVVRLKGGDPFVFGRGGEEVAYLSARGVATSVVPGITAALGAAARIGQSLTERGRSTALTLVTGHLQSDGVEPDWAALAATGGTFAIYMGRTTARRTAAGLTAGGLARSTPVVAIENATTPHERIVRATLATIANVLDQAHFEGPTLLLVGAVLGDVPAPAHQKDTIAA